MYQIKHIRAMNKELLLPMIALMFFTSCRNVPKDATSQKNASSFEETLATNSPVTLTLPQKILPIDLLHPTDMIAIDTFLVIMQHHEENIINVFSTNSYKFLGHFLKKGNGPDEVVLFGRASQWFVEDGEPKIVIQSFPSYIGILNIRKSLEAGQTVYDRKYTFETETGKHLFMASNSIYLMSPSELMMTKDPVRSGIKENSNAYWEFYDWDHDKVDRKLVYENFTGRIDPFSKASDRVLKPDHTKMALLYNFVNLISIADLNEGKIKKIYPAGKKFDIEKALDVDSRCAYFNEGEGTDRYIFALSSKSIKVNQQENADIPFTSRLDIYDWDGNYIYQTDLGERIRLFSVDNKQKYMYAVNDNDSIIRYDLSLLH